ncbi:hypothetical protein [Oceanisphaera ostreae]|uniref:Uncharacterized protein n=1 Tax=Oceanisphaera ostreae TaxID=914151 RepID=A0ABW3KL67_9GAMM
MERFKDATDALLVQQHQQSGAQRKLGEVRSGIESLTDLRSDNLDALDDLDAQLEALMAGEGIDFDIGNLTLEREVEAALQVDTGSIEASHQISLLEVIEGDSADWAHYMLSVRGYAEQNGVDLNGDPFIRLMTESQRIVVEKRIDEDLTYKAANCDKYDYMLAGTCGMIAGLVDVLFVGLPGTGSIGKGADQAVDNAVMGLAKILGWKGGLKASNKKASAIAFLEGKFKVNYDQTHTNKTGSTGTDGKVRNLLPTNHHIKNLAHSPDLIGLFFSIVNQFNSTSTFVSDGRLITIDTETFELKGGSFPAKIFAGFCNWLGHLASDMAGSSGSAGNSRRGTGIPMPFYSMLQFLDFGSFGQHRDTFAKVAVKVFEQGYDMRHGIALAVPVLIAELLTRLTWTFKQRVYHKKEWKDCVPTANNPELRRMLLVAHGTLCVVDGVDAGLRSGGDIVQFMLRSNVLAWARFGTLAVKELRVWYKAGGLDIDAANEHLDAEYKRLLKSG